MYIVETSAFCAFLIICLLAINNNNTVNGLNWESLKIFPESAYEKRLHDGQKNVLEDVEGEQGRVMFRWHQKYGAVAIKVSGNNEEVAFREMKVLRHLRKFRLNNVLQSIREYRDANNEHTYIVTIYIGERNLEQFLKEPWENRMSEKLAAKNIATLLEVLIHLKRLGIVHRDIKPANIILNVHDEFVLADFGMAVFLEEHAIATFAGSAYFKAPEVLAEESQDYASDVWSVGVVMLSVLEHDPMGPFMYDMERNLTDSIKNDLEAVEQILTSTLLDNVYEEVIMTEAVPFHAQDLVKKILVIEPIERISPIKALEHYWFTSNGVKLPAKTTCEKRQLRNTSSPATNSSRDTVNRTSAEPLNRTSLESRPSHKHVDQEEEITAQYAESNPNSKSPASAPPRQRQIQTGNQLSPKFATLNIASSANVDAKKSPHATPTIQEKSSLLSEKTMATVPAVDKELQEPTRKITLLNTPAYSKKPEQQPNKVSKERRKLNKKNSKDNKEKSSPSSAQKEKKSYKSSTRRRVKKALQRSCCALI